MKLHKSFELVLQRNKMEQDQKKNLKINILGISKRTKCVRELKYYTHVLLYYKTYNKTFYYTIREWLA